MTDTPKNAGEAAALYTKLYHDEKAKRVQLERELAEAEARKEAPFAYIEHHKGGDNLVWEQTNLPCTPLYKIAAPQGVDAVETTASRVAPAESATVMVPMEVAIAVARKLELIGQIYDGDKESRSLAFQLRKALK